MSKIDTEKWQTFKISDIFLDLERGQCPIFRKLETGNTPVVTSSVYNQGINGYYNIEAKYNNKITVSLNGYSGYFSYHPYSFTTNSDCGVLHERIQFSKNIALFLCTILNKIGEKYNYGEKLTKDKLFKENILLPIDSNRKPDWEYMESYMKNIMQESKKNIENLQNISKLKRGIQTEKWGSFSCSELFVAKNTDNLLARDVEDGSGNTPYVTASSINNGVVAHIDASKYNIIEGHCILIGGKTFTVTYQENDFVSNDSHNFVIRTKGYNISDLSYKYLATIICFYFSQKYSWNDAVTKDKFLSENIFLPMNSKGKPDWEYMENYMKEIEVYTKDKLNKLQSIL